MRDMSPDTSEAKETADTLRVKGKTATFVAIGGKLSGIVAVADPTKETNPDAIKKLLKAGLRIIMATGDWANGVNCPPAKPQLLLRV